MHGTVAFFLMSDALGYIDQTLGRFMPFFEEQFFEIGIPLGVGSLADFTNVSLNFTNYLQQVKCQSLKITNSIDHTQRMVYAVRT